MFSNFVWLNPTLGQAALQTASNLMKGEVPAPAQQLAGKLESCTDAECMGVLKDQDIRKELATGVKKLKDISNASAANFVEALVTAIESKVKGVKEKASKLEKSLPTGPKLPTYAEVCAALPKNEKPGSALREDWILWHAPGQKICPDQVSSISEAVLRKRLSIAAAAPDGVVADCALAMEVLENLDVYVAWELSLAGNKVRSTDIEVQTPFTDKVAKEVAIRRVLMSAGLLADVSATIVEKVSSGMKVVDAVKDLASISKSSAVLPLYVEPLADSKNKGAAKGDKNNDSKGNAGAGKKGVEDFAKFHSATATQELQWALLAYHMRPRTTLGASAEAGNQGRTAKNVSNAPRPAGFAGTWAPVGDGLPPGHTPYSWNHAEAKGMDLAPFARTWQAQSNGLPPGHTDYSWDQVLTRSGSASSGSAKPTSNLAKDKAPSAVPAPGKAKVAAAAPSKAVTAADGSDETQLAKLDLRCGVIVSCERVPDADTLYLLSIDIGDEKPRQVVSSLVKHYKEEELNDRQVVVYCNIKPGKMRGYESQAMILAACKDKGTEGEIVQLLMPPSGVKVGTRVKCGEIEIGSASGDVNISKISKVWGACQPHFHVNDDKVATFKGTVWTFPQGPITTFSVTNVGIY